MNFIHRLILLGISSILIFVKQLIISQNIGAEYFGLYSLVFLLVASYQQLGGIGSQVWYSAKLVGVKSFDESQKEGHLEIALVPFLFTAPIMFFVFWFVLNSLYLGIFGFFAAILNVLFIIQLTQHYIFSNTKFCIIQAVKGLFALIPMILTMVTSKLELVLLCEVLVMAALNYFFYVGISFKNLRTKFTKQDFWDLIKNYAPAIYLSFGYAYFLKIYVSTSYAANVVGVFFFAQIIIMISQNIQYALSVFLGPIVRKYHSILNKYLGKVVFSYLFCLCVNSLFFYFIFLCAKNFSLSSPQYSWAAPLLLPTVCVAIVRASDILSIFTMLLNKPIVVSVQQTTSILSLLFLIHFFDLVHQDEIGQLTNLLWFEFYSIFVGQMFALSAIIFLQFNRSELV